MDVCCRRVAATEKGQRRRDVVVPGAGPGAGARRGWVHAHGRGMPAEDAANAADRARRAARRGDAAATRSHTTQFAARHGVPQLAARTIVGALWSVMIEALAWHTRSHHRPIKTVNRICLLVAGCNWSTAHTANRSQTLRKKKKGAMTRVRGNPTAVRNDRVCAHVLGCWILLLRSPTRYPPVK